MNSRTLDKLPGVSRACPICEGKQFKSAPFNLVRCVACDAVLNPLVWEPGADEELEETWFDGDAYQPDRSAWTKRFDRWNASATWKRLHDRVPDGGRILEIGPGAGATLAFLRDKGYSVTGCDVSRTVCEHVTASHGIAMHHGPTTGL